jgi:hypothetical protein
MNRSIPFYAFFGFLLLVQSAIGQNTAPNQKDFKLTIQPAKIQLPQSLILKRSFQMT